MTSTSVRVALRVRPLNNKEILQNCSECLTIIPDAPQILIGTDKSFTFDYVFPSDTEQEEVFHDCASPLIDKFVEGYNVTILAYGQTGSGKTYSMGTALDSSNIPLEFQGIVPRAINKLFADLNERKEKNPSYEFEVYVSFLELYNEDLIDLFNKKGKSDLMIREDENSQIYWAGVKEVQVSDPDELLGQLQKGSLCRTVASTDMNMVSSRSHAIFSVILKQTRVENLEENKENDASPPETSTASKRKSKQKSLTSKVTSKFHFVDLAGSERLKRTNAVGDRAKEGIAINSGLLAVGNVISALGDESRKVTHIPYRDSKLTRLLQDSLGGNSQTLMLACVSPADSNFMETLNTLKYANRARNIKNKVSVNESYGGNSVEINQLRGQISRLKMEIQTLRAGGCNEETSRKYEEEIKGLKGELGMTKMKLQSVEQELISTKAEKNTLLMEISFNDQDLSDADREHRIKTHRIVQGYESEIKDLKDQISELLATQASQHSRKSSLTGTTPVREKGHIKFSDPHIYSSDEDIHNLNNHNNNSNNKENGEKKGKKKKKRSSKKSKTRADGHFPVSDETSTTKISPIGSSSSHHQLEHVVNDQSLEEAKSLFTPYEEDEENIEEEDGENVDNESFKLTRILRRRNKTKDKLEKAKEKLRQSYMIIKNGGSLHDDPILSQLIKQPSSTKSESYIDQMIPNHKEKRISSSVSFSEIQTIEVPEWQESNPQPPQPTRRTSNSSRSVSFSDQPISPGSTEYSQDSTDCSSQQQQNVIALTRMLHQIQTDMAVKEQLVSQLERAEQEYTYMRAQYEQKLADMQEALITLQQERNAAVKRAQNANTGISTRDKNSILAELKARYEHKMKRLIQEIGEIRRKYNETIQSNATSKNQNETMLKSMRAQIEQLKSGKMRMMKRMKDEAERVREMTERNQREIQNLRREEKSVQEQKKRFERTSEMQKIMLEKRQKEVLQTNIKLKSVMNLLKRTTTPKSITKAFRNHKRNQSSSNDEDRKESRRSTDDFSPIYDEVFASGYDKKKLLDEAIYKYISGRQTLVLMDECIVKRNNLQEEKVELLEEREKIITSEIGNELGGDAQALDDKIEMITSEIAYINAKIHSLQSSIVAEQEEKSAENSKESEDKSRKNSIKSSKIEKKHSFIIPENATPEASYDVAVRILQNLDEFESYTILESFFKDIVDLRTGDWSRQMTLEQQEKTIMELKKTLLAMRRAAVLTTSEYEKKNRELEEALRLGGRSSPLTPEKRELQMDDIENSTSNAISLFDYKLDQAYAEVEAAVSATLGAPGQMGSSSRRNSYFFDDDAAYFSSSPLSASPMNTGNNRASFSRPPIPSGWLNLQPREKILDSDSDSDNNNNVKRRSSNGRRLKRPSNGPSTPSTPKDENFSPLERTRSLNSQPLERTRSIGQPLERTRSSDQHLERARAGVQLSSSRRSSLRDESTILTHSRQSSSTSMGFHLNHIYSSDEDIHYLNNHNNNDDNNNNKENGEKKGKKKKKRSSKKSKTRADSHFPVSDETSTTKISPIGSSSSHHQLEHVVNDQSLEEAKSLFTPYEEDEENIEEEDGENVDNESFKLTRILRRRNKTKDKLEKAKEKLRQSYMIIKNGGSLHDDPILSQLIKQPSSTKSESYIDQMIPNHKEKRRSSSVSFSEIQTIEVPEWQESNPQPPQPTRRTSNSSRSVSFSDRPISPGSTEYSQDSTDCSSQQQQNVIALTRMLHQIQTDMAVKEQLVSQLERAEQEYTYMRAQYEQKLADMQEALITLQQERNTAVKRAQNASTSVSTRDKNSILAELKIRYENKMKRLIQEIGEIRRKYNEATQSNSTLRNQNETILKSMRAQIEQLKSEKMRMMKHMKDEAERVREMAEREIQNLRRKEKSAQEQKKRFERTSEMQKIMLEKRQKEVLQTNSKLKSVMSLLKRTTTPKSITKAIRNHKRQSISNNTEDGKESRRFSDDLSPIYDEVFASGYDKKKLLDEAIYKYISGRQTLTLMDDWIVKRNNLQEEKVELLEEREKIITSEIGNELGGDAQALDDNIEMITSEIAYINAKIHSLQSSIFAEQEEKSAENSKESEDKSRKNSIKSSKIEKKHSFIIPENATPEASYDVAVRILQNLDEFESYTILESFFKDIVDLRTGDWSRQMTLEQQEKTIMELKKTLLAMRRAAVLTTSEYEKKNRELEEALRLGGRSSPLTPEKRELQMDDIENSTSNAISLFDYKLDQAYAEVEAAVSATLGAPGQMGSSSRRNSYFFDDDAAYFSSSPLSASPMNTGNNRASFSRPPIPSGWLNLQPREKILDSDSDSDNNNNVKRRSSNGRRLKRPSNGPSTPSTPKPSTPKDENISPLERTRSIGQPLERTRSSNQHLERARAGVQLSSSRRSSLRDGSTILAHSRQSSSTST
ncbi:unnamed protein product [Rhizophagus irregularis]|nr:unnamed protein product [Rhizophagus irregularis]